MYGSNFIVAQLQFDKLRQALNMYVFGCFSIFLDLGLKLLMFGMLIAVEK